MGQGKIILPIWLDFNTKRSMCWTVTIPINGMKRGTVLFLVVVAATIPSPSSSTGTSIHLGQSHFYSFLMTVLQYDWAIYWNDVRRLNFWNLVRLKPDPQSPITALWFFFIKYFSNIYSTAMKNEQNWSIKEVGLLTTVKIWRVSKHGWTS